MTTSAPLIGNRHLSDGQSKALASEIAAKLNMRYDFLGGRYGYKHLCLDGYAVTLIYFTYGNAHLLLLNSGHLRKSKEVSARIRSYLDRWGVEECYKFLKQSFGIEKARVTSYEGIRCLLGVNMFAWQVLIDVSADDELKNIVVAEAKMINRIIVFDYYRLSYGLKRLLSLCKELFRFRKRKPRNKALTIEDFLPKQDRFAYGV